MPDKKLNDQITPEELASLLIGVECYRPREGGLDIRPDLFTLNRHNLECEIRRLQMLNFRLAQTLAGASAVFRTDDGYRLLRVVGAGGKTIWTDGDLTFASDSAGKPVGTDGVRLSGTLTLVLPPPVTTPLEEC